MPLYGRFRGFFVFCVCVRLAAPPPLCGLVGVKKRRPPPTHPHLKIVDNSRLRPALKVAVSRVFQGFSRRLPSHPALSRISQISCLPTPGCNMGRTNMTGSVTRSCGRSPPKCSPREPVFQPKRSMTCSAMRQATRRRRSTRGRLCLQTAEFFSLTKTTGPRLCPAAGAMSTSPSRRTWKRKCGRKPDSR